MTAREQGAAILSGAKMRMLEEAGLTVVDAKRLGRLEKLLVASIKMKQAMRDVVMYGGYDLRNNPYRREETEAWKRYEGAEREIMETANELEER